MRTRAVDSHLHVHLLGGFSVSVGDAALPASAFRLRAAGLLVKLLALSSGYRLHREQVMDALWPDADPESAARNLRYALHIARKTLASTGQPVDGFLERVGESIALGPQDQLTVDAVEFETATERAWRSDRSSDFLCAIELYRGELLPEDRYEDWIDERRSSLRRSHVILLGRLAQMQEAERNLSAAIQTLQRVLAIDPTDEQTHAHLMRLYAAAGQRGSALRQYERLATILKEELAVAPDEGTRELADAIRAGTFIPVEPPGSRGTGRARAAQVVTRLPAPLTRLIGRELEVAELSHLLATRRLVTLTGTGGVGKTRLALEVAGQVADRFDAGVSFIDLASARDPSLVLPLILRSLDITDASPEPALDRIANALQDRAVLIVLDNVEHLLACAPDIARLLTQCAGLRVLATSRARLNMRGEQRYPVSPLALPPLDDASVASARESPAVQLFAERATEADPTFRLDETTAPAVAAICRRLDGLPLALELAAAHVEHDHIDALLAQLERRLDRLDDGPIDLPERQRALRSAIAWSYDLLDVHSQRMFRSLAPFAGGSTLAAAAVVAEMTERDATRALRRLVELSLIRPRDESGARARYAMLETIAEYAGELAQAHDEADRCHARHATWIVDLAREADAGLLGSHQAEWLDRLSQEAGNIQAALVWLSERSTPIALALAGSLERYWWMSGRLTEGRYWLDRLLSMVSPPTVARARALRVAGILALDQGDLDRAGDCLDAALATLDAHDDLDERRLTLNNLGELAVASKEYERGRVFFERNLELATQGQDARALMSARVNLATVLTLQRRFEDALVLAEANVRLARDIEDAWSIRNTLGNLAWLYVHDGRARQATAPLREAMSLDPGDRPTVGAIDHLAIAVWVLASSGLPGEALQVLAAATAAAEAIDVPLTTFDLDREMLDDVRHSLAVDLTQPDFDFAWAAGSAMPFDAALAYALDALGRLPQRAMLGPDR